MLLKLGLTLLVLPLLIVMGFWSLEFIEVSNCIHAGGSYDYMEGLCLQEGQGRFIPFSERYPLLVSGSLWGSCFGLLLSIIGLYRRRM
ncbi:hypothetical protein [Marinospirillum celere]|uniref:hypothetical protein n=1 Tax=Marinospirillum celere TaxID=1122252 RepID=UPI000B81280F|nr:hypothetical protein [Marinospirillum celere]